MSFVFKSLTSKTILQYKCTFCYYVLKRLKAINNIVQCSMKLNNRQEPTLSNVFLHVIASFFVILIKHYHFVADTNAFKCCIQSSLTSEHLNQEKTKFGIIDLYLWQLEYGRIFCLVRYLVTQQTSFVSEQILTETLSLVPFGPI
jgi:hypothetical protein